MVSFAISSFYEYHTIEEKVIKRITNPVYEVTTQDNLILDKDKPSIQIDVNGNTFAEIKNSNCKEIKEIRVVSSMNDTFDVYSDIKYKLFCDDKEIKK
jgi:hypothetical protein